MPYGVHNAQGITIRGVWVKLIKFRLIRQFVTCHFIFFPKLMDVIHVLYFRNEHLKVFYFGVKFRSKLDSLRRIVGRKGPNKIST